MEGYGEEMAELLVSEASDDSEVNSVGIVGGLNGVLAQGAEHQSAIKSVAQARSSVVCVGAQAVVKKVVVDQTVVEVSIQLLWNKCARMTQREDPTSQVVGSVHVKVQCQATANFWNLSEARKTVDVV